MGLAAHPLQAQSQSQVGVNLGRQWLLYNHVGTRTSEGFSGGGFFHHQFKGRHRNHSPLGVLGSIDYLQFQDSRPMWGFGGGIPFNAVGEELEIDALAMRLGLVINLNSSRDQRLQAYIQLGYQMLHNLQGNIKYVFSDGTEGPPRPLVFSTTSDWLHNVYAALDLRYRIGDWYFAGVSGQFSTIDLLRERPGTPVNFAGVLTFGRIIVSKAEIEKKERRLWNSVF